MKKWPPVFLYAFFIFYLSTHPGPALPTFTHSDKVIHFLFYVPFGILLARTVDRRKVLVAFLGAAIYGLFLEGLQAFIPERQADLLDVAADALGGVTGGWVLQRLQQWQRSSRTMG